MPVTPEEFDAVASRWKAWQSTPWGQLLYSTSRLNIQRHVGTRTLHIMDIGGGNGMDSLYYARQGHAVTLLDYSAAMLVEARQAALDQGVAKRITFFQADVSALSGLFSAQPFDLVLCHLMIGFVPDTPALLQEICRLMPPGCLLSLIDTNRYSEAYRIAFRADDLPGALQAVGNRGYPHPWFDRLPPLFSPHEFIGQLHANACALVGRYGIRCICDYLPIARKSEPQYYAELERLEHRLTDTYPYYLLARFYQLMAREK